MYPGSHYVYATEMCCKFNPPLVTHVVLVLGGREGAEKIFASLEMRWRDG